jgi:hypothetical protein
MTPEVQMARIRDRLARTTEDDRSLRVMLVLAHEAVRRGAPPPAVEDAHEPVGHGAPTKPLSGDHYADLVDWVSRLVVDVVAPGSTVLVVSRGDDQLLPPGVDAQHFPQAGNGRYAGFYPADSDDAVAQLDSLRAGGAAYLVFPATAFWWLDFYGGLARHLLTTARAIHHDEQCLIFDLRAHNQGDAVS